MQLRSWRLWWGIGGPESTLLCRQRGPPGRAGFDKIDNPPTKIRRARLRHRKSPPRGNESQTEPQGNSQTIQKDPSDSPQKDGMGGVIVDDGVDHLSNGNLLLDDIEEANELLMAMALHVAADHRAVEDAPKVNVFEFIVSAAPIRPLPGSLAPCDAEEGGGNHRDCTEHDQMDRGILIDEGRRARQRLHKSRAHQDR